MSTKDTVQPEGKWEFDEKVAKCFDNMLARSIPQYAVMREAVTNLACEYLKPCSDVLDLGCSWGETAALIMEKNNRRDYPLRFILNEISAPMRQVCYERFKEEIRRETVRIDSSDLRKGIPPCVASVITSTLTLQFVPIEYRQRIVSEVYDNLVDGGAFLLVEKVLGGTAALDSSMAKIYYRKKKENGYSYEDIERKRLSLEGILVPITAAWNEDLLRSTGFREVDCFWRWMNFAGWIAIK